MGSPDRKVALITGGAWRGASHARGIVVEDAVGFVTDLRDDAGEEPLPVWLRDILGTIKDSINFVRVRTHYSHQMTAAARLMAAMKFLTLRSKRLAMRRQSLKRQNIRSMTLRCL